TFSSTGKALKFKPCLNSTDNLTSPYIINYRAQIIPSSPTSLQIQVGNEIGMTINYTLNSTTTPLGYTGSDSGINSYINESGQTGSYILIPLTFILGSGGTIELSNGNLTEDINPVRLNTTAIQALNLISFKLDYTGGTVQLGDLKFDKRGSKNITIVAHSGTYANSINKTIYVKFSPFNATILPQGIDYWDVGPNIYSWTQDNIPPFGNEDQDGNPFWSLTKIIWDHSVDIYIRYNANVNTCQVTWFQGVNNTNNSNFNITINASSRLLIANITTNNLENNISTWTNISCEAYNSTLIFPYFCFNSLCSDCVKTSDYDVGCDWIA
ncbi:unnamed protein product, partial [marine sediment metagenome]